VSEAAMCLEARSYLCRELHTRYFVTSVVHQRITPITLKKGVDGFPPIHRISQTLLAAMVASQAESGNIRKRHSCCLRGRDIKHDANTACVQSTFTCGHNQ